MLLSMGKLNIRVSAIDIFSAKSRNDRETAILSQQTLMSIELSVRKIGESMRRSRISTHNLMPFLKSYRNRIRTSLNTMNNMYDTV